MNESVKVEMNERMNNYKKSKVYIISELLLSVADTDTWNSTMSTAIIFVLLMCSVLCHVDARPDAVAQLDTAEMPKPQTNQTGAKARARAAWDTVYDEPFVYECIPGMSA